MDKGDGRESCSPAVSSPSASPRSQAERHNNLTRKNTAPGGPGYTEKMIYFQKLEFARTDFFFFNRQQSAPQKASIGARIRLFPPQSPEHIPINLCLRTPLHDAPQRHWVAAITRRRAQRRRTGHRWQTFVSWTPAGGGGGRGAGGVIRVRLACYGCHWRKTQVVIDRWPPSGFLLTRVGWLSGVGWREDGGLWLAVRPFPTGIRTVLCEAVVRPCRRWNGVFAILGTLASLLRDGA